MIAPTKPPAPAALRFTVTHNETPREAANSPYRDATDHRTEVSGESDVFVALPGRR